MELRQLEYVVALAETESFTEAARRSHVVPSGLSHQVARLESELGARLFERTSRVVRITPAGRVVVSLARRVLRDVARIHDEVDSLGGGPRGRLRIGMTQTAGRVLDLVDVLGRYRRAHDQVALAVSLGPVREHLRDVVAGELDVAVAARTLEVCPEHVVFTPLVAREPLVAVVGPGHALARRRRTTLAELADLGPFVLPGPGSGLRSRLDEAFRTRGITPRVAFEIGQLDQVVRFARAGLGAAVVPAVFTAPPEGRPGPVLKLADADLALTIGAYTRDDRESAAVAALLHLLAPASRSSVRDPAPGG